MRSIYAIALFVLAACQNTSQANPHDLAAKDFCKRYGYTQGTPEYMDCYNDSYQFSLNQGQKYQPSGVQQNNGNDALLGATGLMLLNNGLPKQPAAQTNCVVWNTGAQRGAVGTINCQ